MNKEQDIDNFIGYFTSDEAERKKMKLCLKEYLEDEDENKTDDKADELIIELNALSLDKLQLLQQKIMYEVWKRGKNE